MTGSQLGGSHAIIFIALYLGPKIFVQKHLLKKEGVEFGYLNSLLIGGSIFSVYWCGVVFSFLYYKFDLEHLSPFPSFKFLNDFYPHLLFYFILSIFDLIVVMLILRDYVPIEKKLNPLKAFQIVLRANVPCLAYGLVLAGL